MRLKSKSITYVGALGVLWYENVENELRLLFRKVNERSGTIGQVFGYYYTMVKRVQTYVWVLLDGSKIGQQVLMWSHSMSSHLGQEHMLGGPLACIWPVRVVLSFCFQKFQGVGLLEKDLGHLV